MTEKKLGRPRSEKTKQAILSSAYELLIENGFAAVTIDKIAERAEVSKATIYKWWENKAAVVIDSFLDAISIKSPLPDTGSTLEDLFIQISNLSKFLSSKEGQVINEIIAEGQYDINLSATYRELYFKPRRLDSYKILEKGIARGDLKMHIDDIELIIDLIYGPIFYRLLITGETVDEKFIRKLLKNIFSGISK